MSYHIVNVDAPRASLTCRHGQLTCTTDEGERSLPLEDVAAIVVTSFSASINSHLFVEAAHHGVALVICQHFKPISLLLPANRSSDTLLTKAALALDRRKVAGLWRKTIDAKCRNQLALARSLHPGHPKLERFAALAEGRARHKESGCSRYHWQVFAEAIADPDFRRDQEAERGPNALLNFGYAVLLAATLQKLFAYGLDPTMGIGHEVRERSAPLAYDLMEPFRPCVDGRVVRWCRDHADDPVRITPEFRRWVTAFTIEKVGYLGIEMEIRACIDAVVRSFREAVLAGEIRRYKPWSPTGGQWYAEL